MPWAFRKSAIFCGDFPDRRWRWISAIVSPTFLALDLTAVAVLSAGRQIGSDSLVGGIHTRGHGKEVGSVLHDR